LLDARILEGTFPASDPLSSTPNPEDDTAIEREESRFDAASI
jgi:hypothetical protein